MTPGLLDIPNFMKYPCCIINPTRRTSEWFRSSHKGTKFLQGEGLCECECANTGPLHTRTSASLRGQPNPPACPGTRMGGSWCPCCWGQCSRTSMSWHHWSSANPRAPAVLHTPVSQLDMHTYMFLYVCVCVYRTRFAGKQDLFGGLGSDNWVQGWVRRLTPVAPSRALERECSCSAQGPLKASQSHLWPLGIPPRTHWVHRVFQCCWSGHPSLAWRSAQTHGHAQPADASCQWGLQHPSLPEAPSSLFELKKQSLTKAWKVWLLG